MFAQLATQLGSLFRNKIRNRLLFYTFIFICMPSKTIAVSEEAYESLDKMKNEGESFTDVVKRLVKRRKLADCAGLWSEVSMEEMAEFHKSIGKLTRG